MRLLGKNISWSLIRIHFVAWVVYYLIVNSLLFFDGHDMLYYLERTASTYALIAIFFYLQAHLVFDKYIPSKQYFSLFIATVFLALLYILSRYILFFIIFEYLHIKSNTKITDVSNGFITDSIYLFLNYSTQSLGYWYAIYSYRLEKQKRILEVEKAQAETEQQRAELSFLQAQINPHFLYNTLNTLYSQALFQAPLLAKSILALSNMMRYTVTESRKNSNYVPLRMELENIENYILIQQTRFDNKLFIDYQIEGEHYIDTLQIPSLILISFVENGIKHGDLKNPLTPFIIRIKLTENSFGFWSRNTKTFGEKEKTTGVGLDNIQNRLALLYKKDYYFSRTDEVTSFTVEMNLYNLQNHRV